MIRKVSCWVETGSGKRNGSVRFEPRIVLVDALGVTQDAAQFGISYAALGVGRVVLSFSGQRLIVQAGFRGLASLVMGKLAPDFPLRCRDE